MGKGVRRIVVVAALMGVGVAGAILRNDGAASADQRWSYSQSIAVRLEINRSPAAPGAVATECVVEGPLNSKETPSVRSSLQRPFEREQLVIYDPQDFGRRSQAGRYRWNCIVPGGVVASGEFEFTAADAATVRMSPQ